MQRFQVASPMIEAPPNPDLSIFVVIPAFQETSLVKVLDSLYQCDRAGMAIEVLVVVNHSADADDATESMSAASCQQVELFARKYGSPSFCIRSLMLVLPVKKAGVGLARKMGMDEAVWRFRKSGNDGIIINLDADCTCAVNYFKEIALFFKTTNWEAAGIYFEHPLAECTKQEREAIIKYELHLRYFINAQLLVGLPYAYHTVGSSMAVRSSAYQRMGGMNSRKAGEDFYFLQKFISIGVFGEILATAVFPSARSSHRVPFGTGRAMGQILSGEEQFTYALQSFLDLTYLSSAADKLFVGADIETWSQGLPETVQSFFKGNNWPARLTEVVQETRSIQAFRKRFLQYFDAFQLMKYVHHCRQWYPDQQVYPEALKLATSLGLPASKCDPSRLLHWYRQRDKSRVG
ncbi:MAG: glycosyltransferase family 2 protein [Saprospiraceae bacterium]|nr:glycosyltransferase family 2 protein [Saprospiraceae bacterium]